MKPNIPKNSQFEKIWWKFWKSVYKRACFSGFTWGAKILPSQNNRIASWMIWYCALRHGQQKLCKQYVGQRCCRTGTFQGKNAKCVPKSACFGTKFQDAVFMCQKSIFLAPAVNSANFRFAPSQNNSVFDIVKAKKGWWKWNCLRK